MTLRGRPPTDAEYQQWRVASVETYAAEELAAGRVAADDAVASATRSYAELLPDGPDTKGSTLLRLVDGALAHDPENGAPEGGAPSVGWLWVSHRAPRGPAGLAWVFDVEVDEHLRGRGYGRAAMLLAEQVARDIGATELGLNVFGRNHAARALYDSLGYTTTSLQMRKPL